MKKWSLNIIKALLKIIVKILFRVKTVNLDKLDMNGRVIIMPNHPSFMDGLFLYLFLPNEAVFVVNTQIAQRFSFFLKFIDYVTIDPFNSYAIKTIIDKVKDNVPIVLFPEGRITTTNGLMKIYDGMSYVALKTGATVYPVVINGPEYSKVSKVKDKVRSRWLPKVRIYVDDPVSFAYNRKGAAKKEKQEVSEKILDIMQNAIFKSRFREDINLFDELINSAKLHGWNTEILEDSKQVLTYRKLLMISYILARKLKPIIGENENVGVLLPNSNGHVSVLFSLFYLNKTPAILNFSAGTQNVVDCAENAGVKIVLTAREFIEKGELTELAEALEKRHEVVYLEDIKDAISVSDKLSGVFNTVLRKRPPQDSHQRVILFTSGSESKPKGVVLKHSNIFANVIQVSCIIDLRNRDKMLNALPMFHSFGLTAGTFLPILSGMSAYLYPSPLHFKVIPELSYNINATIILGTSTFLAGWGKYAHPYDFYSVRYAIAGGEKLKDDVRELWQEKFGIRVLEGYGCTEMAPVLSVGTPLCYKQGSVGRILPGINYKIEKIDGINEGGKLLVQGPNLMEGYLLYGRGFVPVDEWYDTGDIVSVDDPGYLTIKSRLKRFAKISGEMVSLNLIEELAIKCFGSQECYAAINVPDPKRGEKIILITTDRNASLQEFKSYLKDNGYSMLLSPTKIICLEDVPVLGSGKTDYVTLKELANSKLKSA